MIQSIVLLGTLALAAYRDFKDQNVYLYSMLLAGVAGIFLHIWYQSPTLPDMLGGAAIGVMLMFIARLTGESIGMGDGLALVVTGIFLGFWGNLELFLMALFFAGATALFLLIVKKKGKKYRLPFLPFLAAAYLIQLL